MAILYIKLSEILFFVIPMLDTVDMRLPKTEVEGVDFLNEIPPHLNPDSIAVHTYQNGDVVTGSLNGLRVSVSSYQIKVGNGSLCKWLLGDNFQTMGRADVQRAIEKLSDELHLPMEKAIITRLDVAENLILKHPLAVYFNHLGEMSRAKRLLEPNGLYYHKRDLIICLYDKIKEQQAKSEPIPELYRGQNVMRYELRYMSRLAKVFNVEAVTGRLLYDEGFYIDLLNRWRETYQAINKINDLTLNFSMMKSTKEFNLMGRLAMIERVGGEIEMLAQIAEAQKRGELTAKQAHDLRKAVKEACKIREGVSVPSEAITELDKKIAEAVRFYR